MTHDYPMQLQIHKHAITTIKRKIKSLHKINTTEKTQNDLIYLYTQLDYVQYKLKEWRESQ